MENRWNLVPILRSFIKSWGSSKMLASTETVHYNRSNAQFSALSHIHKSILHETSKYVKEHQFKNSFVFFRLKPMKLCNCPQKWQSNLTNQDPPLPSWCCPHRQWTASEVSLQSPSWLCRLPRTMPPVPPARDGLWSGDKRTIRVCITEHHHLRDFASQRGTTNILFTFHNTYIKGARGTHRRASDLTIFYVLSDDP